MKRARNALLLSFLVYLLPVIHVHGGNILGLILWAEFAGGYSDREPLWLAMDAGLAIALQASAFAVFYWMLDGRRWRWLLLLPSVPAGLALLNFAYMIEIPKRFLIEQDTSPESGDWPVGCEIMDASTIGLPTGVTLALERAGEIWLRLDKENSHGLLKGADCSVAPRELFFPGARGGIGYVTGGGTMHYRLDREGDGIFDHWYAGTGVSGAGRLAVPGSVDYWSPVVDANGGALAWLETRRGGDGKIAAHLIVIRDLANGSERRIKLRMAPYASPQLLDFSLTEGVFHILRNYRELLRVGIDGAVKGTSLGPEDFDGFGRNIRLLEGGWVVWDGYREAARYRVAWSLPAGKGQHEIPKGRSITSLSVDPGGRYIAISASRNLSIGDTPDTMFVIRAADGVEIYRRYLAPYTRSHISFLGPDRLAMTVIEDGRARVRVLAVPPRN
jgi:hypothetical protein